MAFIEAVVGSQIEPESIKQHIANWCDHQEATINELENEAREMEYRDWEKRPKIVYDQTQPDVWGTTDWVEIPDLVEGRQGNIKLAVGTRRYSWPDGYGYSICYLQADTNSLGAPMVHPIVVDILLFPIDATDEEKAVLIRQPDGTYIGTVDDDEYFAAVDLTASVCRQILGNRIQADKEALEKARQVLTSLD